MLPAQRCWLRQLILSAGGDDAFTYLEDDPAVRARADYPVKTVPADGFEERAVIEKDVAVMMRDGTRLSANVFRPKTPGPHPVIMALTAYHKDKGPALYPKHLRSAFEPDFDHGRFAVSPWTVWEGPDPVYWVGQGYAVVTLDARGFALSGGKPGTLSMQDRDDFYDAIEWAGTQAWSNGRVGLSGVSYLAIAQWVAASGRPPHLHAIMPWEGQSDAYREVLYHGGIPSTGFTGFWLRKMRAGANGSPLPPPFIFNLAHRFPALMRRVQARPAARSGISLPDITVPALICASWSDQGLHTRGSFEGYKQIGSQQKWLYTHGGKKWQVYYSAEALAVQTAFFDRFLKNRQNGFEQRPAVRLEVRETKTRFTVRQAADWPLPDTRYERLYLDAAAKTLAAEPPPAAAADSYDGKTGRLFFDHVFAADTELTGNMKLKLFVSTDAGRDMDLFVTVEKRDAANRPVHFNGMAGFEKAPAAHGWLRVSQRRLDAAKSTPQQPVLAHDGAQPIRPGDVVPVEIEILPSSTLFRAGERLRLVVQGHDAVRHAKMAHGYPVNKGRHSLHAGGAFDAHLLVPVIPRRK